MLILENISKTFDDFNIENVGLKVTEGEYAIILGKSGTGKTLILELIAGFMKPDDGKIWLNNVDITDKKITNRDVGLVFQDYAIFPHKTVFGNIAYPIKERKNLKSKVLDLARQTGIDHLLHRYPSTLSGGEVQRAVLARTLAAKPNVLLLDEPLTSLDVQYKKELQSLLRELNRKGQTIIHVTHDYEEALSLADRVAVMHDGRIIQQGKVHDVFRNPANKFVADFVGIRNFFYGTTRNDSKAGYKVVRISKDIDIAFSEQTLNSEKCIVTVNAENIILSREKLDSTALNNFQGKVKEIIPTSAGMEVIVDIGVDIAAIITQESCRRLGIDKEIKVWLSFKASAVSVSEF
jgi:molybdopterin-binding protein